jgi:hypothetical protein
MGSFIICIHHRTLLGRTNQGVCGACGTHGRREKSVQSIGGKARRRKDHWKDQGVDGCMGSEWILGILVGMCGVDSPCSG